MFHTVSLLCFLVLCFAAVFLFYKNDKCEKINKVHRCTQYNAVQYKTIQYSTIQLNTTNDTTQFNETQDNTIIMQYSTI